ncbi:MAG: hypothetical protein KGL19_03680 [Bacteroidota bacterium]|nr:hypothetical protein [Bacteroidota bacterium]
MKGFLLILLIILCCTSCFKNLTQLTVIYENNFDDYNQKGIKTYSYVAGGQVNDIKIVKFNNNIVLGTFNNARIEISLPDLPQHTAITVSFDLYIHDMWRNDLWKFSFDGTDYQITGFSNDSTVEQSYPNNLGNGSPLSPAMTGAIDKNLPGACALISSPHGTSMYKIERTILHSASTFDFSCSDAGSYAYQTCNRSWSIDNLKITMIKN